MSGVPTFRHGEATGELPGTLVRNPRADISKYQNIAPQVSTAFDGWVPEFVDREGALDGLGEKGGSAAARLLRDLDVNDAKAKL